MTTTITIDDEFRDLLPPPTDDEFNRLQIDVVKHGCLSPLVVWKEWGILIDGHNRYEICTRENIPFETVELSFHGRDDVKLWMLKNQLGRRNLTDAQRVELCLRLKPEIEAKAKAQQVRRPVEICSDNVVKTESKPVNTRAEIAKLAGVSEGTVAKVETVLQSDDEQLKQDMLAGEDCTGKKVTINAAANVVKKKELPTPAIQADETPVPDKGIERAHEAIAVLRKISVRDKFLARAYEIVGSYVDANPRDNSTDDPGWIEMKAKTLGKLKQYCSRNRKVCDIVERDLRRLLKIVQGYAKEEGRNRVAAARQSKKSPGSAIAPTRSSPEVSG